MRDDPVVVALVTRARLGDHEAWDALVERYAPLVWSICRRHRLDPDDAADVAQRIWLRLVEQLPGLREPAALPGWIVTTTRRECLLASRMTRQRADRERETGSEDLAELPDAGAVEVDQAILVAERHEALRQGFAQLPERCQRLLTALLRDPQPPYSEISAELPIPIGSIGPTRARCLDHLRRTPALAALIAAESQRSEGGEGHARSMVER